MTAARILIVDDEPQIRRFMRISLAANGYDVIEAETGEQGVERASAENPDLVILDLGLPDMEGHEAISAIRAASAVPILVLSVRAEETDKVEALDRGANDYVVKPFGIGELMARIRVALRAATGRDKEDDPGGDGLTIGTLVMDFERRIVARDGQEIRLSRKEYDLLQILARKPDHVITHRQILRDVWGPAHVQDMAYLRVYVNQLRQKLEDNPAEPKLIVTEPGVGYRLKTE